MRGQDAVINLVGILHSRDVVLPTARILPRPTSNCRRRSSPPASQAGVRRLVHMSALGADPKGPSEYLCSKGDGEAIVMAAKGELDVTVFRPSVIFGLGDSFLSMFAGCSASCRSSRSASAMRVSSRSGWPMSPMLSSIAWAIRPPSARPTIWSAQDLHAARTGRLHQANWSAARADRRRCPEGWAYLQAGPDVAVAASR
jgi:hypothetical protein